MTVRGFAVAWDAAGSIGSIAERVPGGSVVLVVAYSRYGGPDPLEHDLRSEIHDVVSRTPGAYLGEIVDRTGGNESTVRYHARVLVRNGLLRSATIWGTLGFYPPGVDGDDFELLAALQDDTLVGVVAAIASREPATVTELADELDRSPGTVSHHLSRLEAAGLVERERTGESVLTTLTPALRDGLADAGAAPGQRADDPQSPTTDRARLFDASVRTSVPTGVQPSPGRAAPTRHSHPIVDTTNESY